jgi:phosphatidate phosphatase APP1
MHLKKFRLELFEPWGIDLTLFNLFKNPTKYKVSTITNIISNFPSRKFILVGDSSEKDPEIYGIITRMHPEKILCAIIRNVSTRPIHISRMQQAFFNVSSSKYITIDSSLNAKSQLNILKINKNRNCF